MERKKIPREAYDHLFKYREPKPRVKQGPPPPSLIKKYVDEEGGTYKFWQKMCRASDRLKAYYDCEPPKPPSQSAAINGWLHRGRVPEKENLIIILKEMGVSLDVFGPPIALSQPAATATEDNTPTHTPEESDLV